MPAPTLVDNLRPITVLMVTDHKYSARIVPWAMHVKALGLQCAVGDVGGLGSNLDAESPCDAAIAAGCTCFNPPSRSPPGAHPMDQDGVMALAVRWRFLFARQLLQRGNAVLMHDADVFFRGSGLESLTQWISTANQSSRIRGTVDFVVQTNGIRRHLFDDLNWGIVWMSGSAASVNLLGCTLDTWQNEAFMRPEQSPRRWYYARSHPRINHVLEDAIQSAPSPAAAPRVCHLAKSFKHQIMRHMSGYASANQKLMCARSEGFLDDPPPFIRGQLIYTVPLRSSVAHQRRALAAAILLARKEQVGLVIPPAVFNGRRVPFCHLFDADSLPEQEVMVQSVSRATRRSYCSRENITNVDALLPFPRATHTDWRQNGTRCVRFGSLLQYTEGWPSATALAEHAKRLAEQEANLTTCHPKDRSVVSYHACFPRVPSARGGLAPNAFMARGHEEPLNLDTFEFTRASDMPSTTRGWLDFGLASWLGLTPTMPAQQPAVVARPSTVTPFFG